MKQKCLKGIDFPGSPHPHTPQPLLLSASYSDEPWLICYPPPHPSGPIWTKHVTSWPIVDIHFSLGVGHVVGLVQYIMTHVHHTEWLCCPENAFVPLLLFPILLKSYLIFYYVNGKMMWVFRGWGITYECVCLKRPEYVSDPLELG